MNLCSGERRGKLEGQVSEGILREVVPALGARRGQRVQAEDFVVAEWARGQADDVLHAFLGAARRFSRLAGRRGRGRRGTPSRR